MLWLLLSPIATLRLHRLPWQESCCSCSCTCICILLCLADCSLVVDALLCIVYQLLLVGFAFAFAFPFAA